MADSSEFFELYRRPEWQQKRLRVMEAAGFRCRECDAADQTLNVHHRYYRKGAKPWEYPDEALWCLCEVCHKSFHSRDRELKELVAELNSENFDMLLGFLKGLVCITRSFDKKCSSVALPTDYQQIGFGAVFDVGLDEMVNWTDDNFSIDHQAVQDMKRELEEVKAYYNRAPAGTLAAVI